MKKSKEKTSFTFRNLIQLSNNFTNEVVCRKYIEQIIWNGKPVCPHCKNEKVYTFKDGKRYKCANSQCHSIFNVTVGTYLENTKIPLCKWLHAIYVFTSHKKGISSHQLGKDIGITQKSAWFLLSRIRCILTDTEPAMLNNTTEVDETYVGGKLANKHQSLKSRQDLDKNYNKSIVLGLIQRDGKVINKVIASASSADILPVIQKHITKGSLMVTDDLNVYRNLPKLGYPHEYVNHSIKEYVRDGFHTNSIEGYFSHLKRGIIGIYHHVSKQHLHRYCSEFSFRYNTRRHTEVGRFDLALNQIRGRLTYEDLIKRVVAKQS